MFPGYETIEFDYLNPMGSILMTVKKGKIGLLDITGREILRPDKYEYIMGFVHGLAVVQVGEKMGMIDSTGREIVPVRYQSIGMESEGLIHFQENERFGFMDRTGKVVVKAQYMGVNSFSEGLCVVGDEKGKFGYIDRTGRAVIPPSFDYANDCYDGYCIVLVGDYYGVLDKTGKEIIPPTIYSEVIAIEVGLFQVKKGEMFGFLGQNGQEILLPKYTFAYYEPLTKHIVASTESQMAIFDGAGKAIVPFKYASLSEIQETPAGLSVLADNVIRVENMHANGTLRSGYLSSAGTEIVPPIYEEVLEYTKGPAGGLVIARRGEQWGVVAANAATGQSGRTGAVREVVPFGKYGGIGMSSEGMIQIFKGGGDYHTGFIDLTGKEIVPIKYDDSYGFIEGLAAVQLGEKWGFIDKTGKVAVPIVYDNVMPFSGNYAWVAQNGKWGMITKP